MGVGNFEFKESHGKGLTRQIRDRIDVSVNPEQKVVMGVTGKRASVHVKRGAEEAGGLVSDDVDLILDLIAPDK